MAEAVAANQRAAAMARDLYLSGLSDFLDVLDAQRNLFQTQSELAQRDAAVSSDLVVLYKSLGGGWEAVTISSCAVKKLYAYQIAWKESLTHYGLEDADRESREIRGIALWHRIQLVPRHVRHVIFVRVSNPGFGLVAENAVADVWVMDPTVRSVEQTTNMPASAGPRSQRCGRAVGCAAGGGYCRDALSKRPVSAFPGNRSGRLHTWRSAANEGRRDRHRAPCRRCGNRRSGRN